MSELKHLGRPSNQPVERVDLIEWTGRPITVRLECAEFTTICPVTGQPDFGQLAIEYIPDRHLVETKSLKLYLWNFRNQQTFNETVIDAIASDLYDQLKPQWLQIEGKFNPRGGIAVTATAHRGRKEDAS